MSAGESPPESLSMTAASAPRPANPAARVVAVIGAASHLGAELVLRLQADARVVRILAIDVRRPTPLPGGPHGDPRTRFHKVDLTVPAADADLAELLERERVDTVVHAAFLSSPTHNTSWAHEVESIGTMHVLNACGEAGVAKLVMLSTTLLYGAHPANPNFLSERHEPRGHSRSRFINEKLDAERQVRRFATENPETVVTILRAAATLGRSLRNMFTRFFLRPVAPVLMGYDPLLQFVHAEDLVDALALSVERDFAGIFNIVAAGVLPYTTVLAMMGKIPLPMPTFVAYPLSRAMWVGQVFDSPPSLLDFLRFLCVADGQKAERVMGFRARHDIKATIADFLGVHHASPGGRA